MIDNNKEKDFGFKDLDLIKELIKNSNNSESNQDKSTEEKVEIRIPDFNPDWIKERFEQGKIIFDLKHRTNFKYDFLNKSNESKYKEFMHYFEWNLKFCTPEKLKNGEEIVISESDYCFECDKKIHYSFDGTTVKDVEVSYENWKKNISETNCRDVGTYSVDIEFPTGKLICADWIDYASELLEHLDNHEYSINSRLGRYTRTMKYAELNVLHIHVGNSSPHIYYKEGLALIGNSNYTEDDDEILLMEDGKEIVQIYTDLWWATIVDAEIYKKLLIDKFGEIAGLDKFAEIEKAEETIKPGVYRCTYLMNEPEKPDEPEIFAKMEWIKDIK